MVCAAWPVISPTITPVTAWLDEVDEEVGVAQCAALIVGGEDILLQCVREMHQERWDQRQSPLWTTNERRVTHCWNEG